MNFFDTPAFVTFLTVIVMFIAVMVISRILDGMWARMFPWPWLYYLVSAPGVIIHECAHVAGCLMVGAKVQKIVFFSKSGGSVTYTQPAVPWLGNVIISTAPLVFIPLFLAGVTWVFEVYGGCMLAISPITPGNQTAAISLLTSTGMIFYQNLIVRFNAWFLLYLYVTTSLVLSLAPSRQDLKNAAAGIGLFIVFGFMILAFDNASATGLLVAFLNLVLAGLTIGLTFECIAAIVSIPLFFVCRPVLGSL
jgi:hypothetical protein